MLWRSTLIPLAGAIGIGTISALQPPLHAPADPALQSSLGNHGTPYPETASSLPKAESRNSSVHALEKAELPGSLQKTNGQKCRKAIEQHPQDCTYILKHCADYGSGLVSYVSLYYCSYPSWHKTMLSFLAVWLGMLFIWLGVSASEYFSPNISTLATLLHLPESLAGVTLLALGNGAPDLFSTFSAVRAGSGALAIGQLVGSAAFIVSVVAGATTLVVPRYKVNRISYLRELGFFVATIAIVIVIVVTERLSRGLALCMVGLYVAYVVTVMVTTYCEMRCDRHELAHGEEEQWGITQPNQIDDLSPLQLTPATYPIRNMYSRSHGALSTSGYFERSRVFGSSSAALSAVTGDSRPQWRRRRTINIPRNELSVEEDLWAPGELLTAHRLSARALGEFLQQHRKSLLAAAECNDILGELRQNKSHAGNLQVLKDGSRNAQNSTASFYGSGGDGNVSTFHDDLRSPVPWGGYTMAVPSRVKAGSVTRASLACSRSAMSSSASDSASNYLQIVPTRNTVQEEEEDKQSSEAVEGEENVNVNNLASKSAPEQHLKYDCDFLSPDSCLIHTRKTPAPQPPQHSKTLKSSGQSIRDSGSVHSMRGSHSSENAGLPCVFSARPNHLGSLASISQYGPQLPSASVVDMLVMSPRPLSSSAINPMNDRLGERDGSVALAISWTDGKRRAAALALICIPTLRHWHKEASLFLKAFIVFSALPVFLLTLTVPVAGDFAPIDDNKCDDDLHERDGEVQQQQQQNILESDETTNMADTQHSNYNSIALSPDNQHQQHHSASPGLLDVNRISRPSSIGSHVSEVICSLQNSYLSGGIAMYCLPADLRWAEEVVSIVRSAISVIFLYSALYAGGYSVPVRGFLFQISIVVTLSIMSLAWNCYTRRLCDPPYKLRVYPCILGFACGLAWVYLIADEIVAITQALGVMLKLSEEILGLTIVGFGNSLGDLVTNLTLARMGYPMMAISACFGGPMLCLLLGVGMAAFGSLASGNIGDGAYWIPLTSPTVLVSAACVMFNSVLFLIIVPKQKYHMTRAVGIMALVVYFVGMAVNIYIEW